MRAKPTLVINLDTVGVGDRVYLAGEASSMRLAAETADDLGMAWSRLRILGAGMDHEPFAARGLAAVSLLGDVVGSSLVLHFPRDVLGLVDADAIVRSGRLASHLAWAWAEQSASRLSLSPGTLPKSASSRKKARRDEWATSECGGLQEAIPNERASLVPTGAEVSA